MILDLQLILGPDPFDGVLFEEGVDQVFAVVWGLDFGVVEKELAVDNILKHFFVVSVVEGRWSVDHLEDENAEGPPIRHERLSFVGDDLGTWVFKGILT